MPHKIIEGQMAMKALMQGPERPTAVICGTDLLAIGALAEAREAGVDVPGDVAHGACSRVLWSDIPNNQMPKPVDRGNRRYRVFQFHYAAARP
jgi:DNA-binding LacI/PurR family transcriptional regulator